MDSSVLRALAATGGQGRLPPWATLKVQLYESMLVQLRRLYPQEAELAGMATAAVEDELTTAGLTEPENPRERRRRMLQARNASRQRELEARGLVELTSIHERLRECRQSMDELHG
jgi:hypothetical protein